MLRIFKPFLFTIRQLVSDLEKRTNPIGYIIYVLLLCIYSYYVVPSVIFYS